ncbi:MAG: hypothetical protein IPK83_24605 [Planctomycetes bacterium]|nr:hypothetical protein [Planctomycetota bacterium]
MNKKNSLTMKICPKRALVGNRGIAKFDRSIFHEDQAMGTNQISSKGLRAGAMAASIALMACIGGCDNQQKQAVEVQARTFDVEDFQWKEFIQALYTADFESAKAQSSDQVFLMLLYLKDMNEVFSDPTMSAFFGSSSKCFTQLYEPKLNAMLEAVVWGEQIPKLLLEVLALAREVETANEATFKENIFLGIDSG